MNDTIKKLIKQYEKNGDFNYASVTDEIINSAEQKLNLKLPAEYTDYIKSYGHGGIAGIEILGVGLTGRLLFVDTTLEYRQEDLPLNLVVIENIDEYLVCIDCNNNKIVSWDFTGFINEEADSFDEYLIEQMNNAIENL